MNMVKILIDKVSIKKNHWIHCIKKGLKKLLN